MTKIVPVAFIFMPKFIGWLSRNELKNDDTTVFILETSPYIASNQCNIGFISEFSWDFLDIAKICCVLPSADIYIYIAYDLGDRWS